MYQQECCQICLIIYLLFVLFPRKFHQLPLFASSASRVSHSPVRSLIQWHNYDYLQTSMRPIRQPQHPLVPPTSPPEHRDSVDTTIVRDPPPLPKTSCPPDLCKIFTSCWLAEDCDLQSLNIWCCLHLLYLHLFLTNCTAPNFPFSPFLDGQDNDCLLLHAIAILRFRSIRWYTIFPASTLYIPFSGGGLLFLRWYSAVDADGSRLFFAVFCPIPSVYFHPSFKGF